MKDTITSKIKVSCLGVVICIAMMSCGGGDKKKEEVTKVDRAMLESPLLAGLAFNNRAIDPEYYLRGDLTSWFLEKIATEYGECESFSRVTFPHLPAGRHALSIKGIEGNPTGCIAWGSIILGVSSVKVKIWASHEQQTVIEDFNLKVSYFDPLAGDENVYQVLHVDETSAQILDGLTWYQFEGVIPSSAQGWADIQITHHANSNLLVNGFSATDVDEKVQQSFSMSKKPMVKKLTNSMKRSLKNRERILTQQQYLK